MDGNFWYFYHTILLHISFTVILSWTNIDFYIVGVGLSTQLSVPDMCLQTTLPMVGEFQYLQSFFIISWCFCTGNWGQKRGLFENKGKFFFFVMNIIKYIKLLRVFYRLISELIFRFISEFIYRFISIKEINIFRFVTKTKTKQDLTTCITYPKINIWKIKIIIHSYIRVSMYYYFSCFLNSKYS